MDRIDCLPHRKLLPAYVRAAALTDVTIERLTHRLGAVLGVAVWVSPAFARAFYIGWVLAAEPIGWTISSLIMAIVFYLVVTPIGLAMRLVGRDPMTRRLEPDAPSYWHQRKPVTDIKQYFRQF